MESLYVLFKNSTLLRTLPVDIINNLGHLNNDLKVIKFMQNEVIHFDGDRCTSLEVIIHGQVVIERIDESGNLMIITEFFPDDILGGNLLFSKKPHYPMTVTAKSNVTLISISKELVFKYCTDYPEFLSVFLEYISDHTLLLGDKLKHYVNRTIRESLIAYLKNESKLQNSSSIHLKISKKALADRIGVQRTSLSRELQKMKIEGLIDFNKTNITLLDKSLFK